MKEPTLHDGSYWCPRCDDKMVVQQNTFFWRGKFMSGLVCKTCNTLWDNPEDSFMEEVHRTADGAQ